MNIGTLDGLEVGKELVDPVDKAEQAWLEQRRGKLTCSEFGCLIGEGRGKQPFTVAGFTYLRRKIAERLGSWHSISAKSMDWGNENEAGAIAEYEKRGDFLLPVCSMPYQFYECGALKPSFPFGANIGSNIGGTPDALVDDDGCLEVKCPYDPAKHVATLISREVPTDYVWQVHGHMLVTGREWCDFCSFDPRIEGPERLVTVRVERDEKRLTLLAERLAAGVKWIETTMAQMRETKAR